MGRVRGEVRWLAVSPLVVHRVGYKRFVGACRGEWDLYRVVTGVAGFAGGFDMVVEICTLLPSREVGI